MAKEFEVEALPESDRALGCLHPRETYNLIGHSQAEDKFSKALSSGRLHHAWLLTGPPGIGKATLAYRMARVLLGAKPLINDTLDVSNLDPISQKVESRGHGNLYIVNRPWDTKTKKFKQDIPTDTIRSIGRFLQGTASDEYARRVIIIDSADDLNRNAENALLKMLEEPPLKTIMILLSSAPGRLLPTTRSRCLSVVLNPVPQKEILEWLNVQGSGSPDLLEACVKLSRGGPGKAMALAQNSSEVLLPLKRYMESLSSNRESVDMPIAKSLSPQNAVIARSLFWDVLEDSIHACAIYSQTGQWEGAFVPPQVKKTPSKWLKAWSVIRKQKEAEAAINMDKTATLLNTLSAIRAA